MQFIINRCVPHNPLSESTWNPLCSQTPPGIRYPNGNTAFNRIWTKQRSREERVTLIRIYSSFHALRLFCSVFVLVVFVVWLSVVQRVLHLSKSNYNVISIKMPQCSQWTRPHPHPHSHTSTAGKHTKEMSALALNKCEQEGAQGPQERGAHLPNHIICQKALFTLNPYASPTSQSSTLQGIT